MENSGKIPRRLNVFGVFGMIYLFWAVSFHKVIKNDKLGKRLWDGKKWGKFRGDLGYRVFLFDSRFVPVVSYT